MKNANMVIITQPTSMPVGTVGADWIFRIGNQGETAPFDKASTQDTKWTFTVDSGAYWVEAFRTEASNGDQVGAIARIEFTIAADTVLVDTADFLGVTITDQEIGIPA